MNRIRNRSDGRIEYIDQAWRTTKRQNEAGAIHGDATATESVVLVGPFKQNESRTRSKKQKGLE